MECHVRAYCVDASGLSLAHSHPSKTLTPDEVRITVDAVALNYRDLLVAQGKYGRVPEKPFVAGSDMAGTVTEIGAGVTGVSIGDRVVNSPFRHWPAGKLQADWLKTFIGASGVDGVLAEEIVFPASALASVPSHLTQVEAATLPIAGLTAWAAVVTHGRLRPGEWALLHGTGGVSIFAAQLVRAMGGRALMTTSSEEKGQRVKKAFGVTETFDYRDDNWVKKVRDYTGGTGVDLVVEVVGGATLSKSLKACTFSGRVSLVGVLDGFESTINPFDIIGRQLTVRGIYTESTEELRAFTKACEALRLKPHIDTIFPFDATPAAYAYLAAQKHIGKVVISLNGET